MGTVAYDLSDLGGKPVDANDLSDLGGKPVAAPSGPVNPYAISTQHDLTDLGGIDMSKVAGAPTGIGRPATGVPVPEGLQGNNNAPLPEGPRTLLQPAGAPPEGVKPPEPGIPVPEGLQNNLPGVVDLDKSIADPNRANTWNPVTGAKNVVQGLSNVAESGILGASPGTGGAAPANYKPQPPDINRAAKGATQAMSGAMEVTKPLMPLGIAAAPFRAAVMYGAGILAGEGAKQVAAKMGATPDEQEFFHTLGFFLPDVAVKAAGLEVMTERQGEVNRVTGSAFGGRVRATAATNPEAVGVAGKVGPFEASYAKPRSSGVNVSDQGPTTLPRGEVLSPEPPNPVDVQNAEHMDAITAAAARAAGDKLTAERIAGAAPMPPPPPPPGAPGSKQIPLPEGMDQGHLSQQTVDMAGQAIEALPPALKPQGILSSVQNLAKWIMAKGTIVGPDNKVTTVTGQSPQAQAQSAKVIATGIINDEVDRRAEAAQAQQDAQKEAIEQRKDDIGKAQEDQQAAVAPGTAAKGAEGESGAIRMPLDDNNKSIIVARKKLQKLPALTPKEKMIDALKYNSLTSDQRDQLADEELARRENAANEAAVIAQGSPPALGQSAEELQRWTDRVAAGQHPYVHIPIGSAFKPSGIETLTRTSVKGAPVKEFNGTYYHARDISPADIRKAARDKTDPQGALDALESDWRQDHSTELKAEDIFDQVAKPESVGTSTTQLDSAAPSTQQVSGQLPQSAAQQLVDALQASVEEYLDPSNWPWRMHPDYVEWQKKPLKEKLAAARTVRRSYGDIGPYLTLNAPAYFAVNHILGDEPYWEAVTVTNPEKYFESARKFSANANPLEYDRVLGELLDASLPNGSVVLLYEHANPERLLPEEFFHAWQNGFQNGENRNAAIVDELNRLPIIKKAEKLLAKAGYQLDQKGFSLGMEATAKAATSADFADLATRRAILTAYADILKRHGVSLDDVPPVVLPDVADIFGGERATRTPQTSQSRGAAAPEILQPETRSGSAGAQSGAGNLIVHEPRTGRTTVIPEEVSVGLAQIAEDNKSTIEQVLADPKEGKIVAQALKNDGIITDSDMNPATALLTTKTRKQITDSVLETVLGPELVKQTPAFVKDKFSAALGTIQIINSRDDEWNLSKPLQAAAQSFNEQFREEEAGDVGPVVAALRTALDRYSPEDFRSAIQQYAMTTEAARNSEPDSDPWFSFNVAFGTELTKEQFDREMKGLKAGTINEPGESVNGKPAVSKAATESSTPSSPAKPLTKGDKVTYTTNKGKERTGEVAWTDGKNVRIKDGSSTVNKPIGDVKLASVVPAEQPRRPLTADETAWAQKQLESSRWHIEQEEKKPNPNKEDIAYHAERIGHLEQSLAAKAEISGEATLVDALQLAFDNGRGPKDYNGLKKIVADFDGKEPDQLRMKQAQEAYEAMLNRVASTIVLKNEGGSRETFDRMVRLYEGQPNLAIRTSTSVQNQAYSTPLPLAFVADRLAGIDFGRSTVYEPTAGNGALLIAANPEKTQANELDSSRAATLKAEGFKVSTQDASTWVPNDKFDAVVANPPFGPLQGPVKIDGYSIVKLDHLIAAKALSVLKDDGKAAIIIGAVGREEAGATTNATRPFFNWLYSHYNVVSDFELEGDLYSRQGASWPVRVIAVEGRRVDLSKVSPVAEDIKRLKTWGEVYDKASEYLGSNLEGQRRADDVAGGASELRAGSGAVSKPAGRGSGAVDRVEPGQGAQDDGRGLRSSDQPRPVQHTGGVPHPRVGSPDITVRSDGDVARSNQLAEGEPAPRVVRREPAKPDGHSANALADESNQFQNPYVPVSAKKDVNVLAPKALIDPMREAMQPIVDDVGDLDEWVKDELGYATIGDVGDAFMGIQVDAIAAAIYQMKQGKALIVADQTGVGKGRVGAALERWAILHGKVPVFITAAANLYSAHFEDLYDIGSGDTVRPLLFNKDAEITDPITGKKMFGNRGNMRPVFERIAQTGKLPEGHNAAYVTYSQINTPNRQQLALKAIAKNAIFILDESHEAAGETSNTGQFLQSILKDSQGVTFLSATPVKRPGNLALYATMTDLGLAFPDKDKMIDAIVAGGAPLQAIITSQLAQSAQYVRRERSFNGITFENVVAHKMQKEHEAICDKVTEVLRGIVAADSAFHNIDFDRIVKEAKKAGKSAASKGVVVNHMEFSSIVHNLVKQLLLALKVDHAADMMIQAIEDGQKPIFALENTMGSFLSRYVDDVGAKDGDLLTGLNYSKILDKALERTRYYNETPPEGGRPTRIAVRLDDLSPAVRAQYDAAQKLIDELNVDLPVSPIDHIRNRVEQAGYKIAEITGRTQAIDYSGNVPKLSVVPEVEKKDRVATATGFNNGTIHALILNESGSTGISLHASEKFADQRPRLMIVGQPAGDVNTVMQMLGRINRTGQVQLPRYNMLAVALPAEQRPAINLARKMKSLNASVTSNTEAHTSIKAIDLMNKYGDQVIGQYLVDNPEMMKALHSDVEVTDDGKLSGTENLAVRATGRSALLPVKQQKAFMEAITDAYTDKINFLNETGQNDLEPRTYDFDAKQIHSERIYQGPDPSSPFGADAHYGEYSIKRQGIPPTVEEVQAELADSFGPEAMKQPASVRDTNVAREIAQHFEELYKPYVEGLKTDGAIERAGMLRQMGRSMLNEYRVGTGLYVNINGDEFNAVVTHIEGAKRQSGNPYAPSSLKFTLAINGPLRRLKVPGTELRRIVLHNLGRNADVRQLFGVRAEGRQKAKIITGNVASAYGQLKKANSSRIIAFTMEDGTVRQGILLPSKFDVKEDVDQAYAMRSPEGAAAYLSGAGQREQRYLSSSGGEVQVIHHGTYGWKINTKVSKSAGGQFFLDPALRAMVVGDDFASSGGMMRAEIKQGQEKNALRIIMQKIALYPTPSESDAAREADEKGLTVESKASPAQQRLSGVGNTYSFLGAGAIGPLAKKTAEDVAAAAKAVVNSKAVQVGLLDDVLRPIAKTAKGAGYEFASLFFPTLLASPEALDIMGHAVGAPALEMFKAAQLLEGISKLFDGMPEADQIEFVDRIQNPENPNFGKQATPELQKAQEVFQGLFDASMDAAETALNLGRTKSQRIQLTRKANYFANRYARGKHPGAKAGSKPEDEIDRIASIGRKPLAPKNFVQKQKNTLKEGVASGGVPLGNPATMALRRLEEGAKFTAAHEMMYQAKQSGLAFFLRNGKQMPPDFDDVPDPIMKVWRPVETAEGGTLYAQTGKWVMQKDAARLLNNYLSKDFIRGSNLGTAAINLKTASTTAKFAFGLYHYFTIPLAALASGAQRAIDVGWNQGVRGLDGEKMLQGLLELGRTPTGLAADAVNAVVAGLGIIPKIPLASRIPGVAKLSEIPKVPAGAIYEGGRQLKFASNPDQYLLTEEGQEFANANSDDPYLTTLLYDAGMRWEVGEDFALAGTGGILTQFKEGHILKAGWAATCGTLNLLAAPLFKHYIPRWKWMLAKQMLADKLEQYSQALADGTITEQTLARQVVTTVENRFGEVNYDRQFLNRTMKSAIQLVCLAPGWKGGTINMTLGAIAESGQAAGQLADLARWMIGQGDQGSASDTFDDHMRDRESDAKGGFAARARQFTSRLPQLGMRAGYVLAMAFTVVVLAEILEKVRTGKHTWQHAEEDHRKNGTSLLAANLIEVAHPRIGGADQYGSPKRMTWPTDLRDIEHVVLSPLGYAKGVLAAPWSALIDTIRNRDYRENYVYTPSDPAQTQIYQGLKYNLSNDFGPISTSQAFDKGGQQDTESKIEKATGLTQGVPHQYDRSAALNRAIEEVHQGDGPQTPEEVEARELAKEHPTVHQARMALKNKDVPYLKRIFEMQPGHGGLTYAQKAEIYDKYATPEERAFLKPIMNHVRSAMIAQARRAHQ